MDAAGLRAFLGQAGALKDTLRSGFTPAGRPESVAEHSWRLALLALALGPRAGVDVGRALALAVVHDLGEAVGGDTPAPMQTGGPERAARERADLAAMLATAPAALRAHMLELWDEYDAGLSPEARFVKAIDKLETVMTHAEGANPPDFDYAFNLGYGRRWTDAAPEIAELRALIDAETARRATDGR